MANRKARREPSKRGAVVGGTDPCVCGHAPEEHGRDPKHLGSTACIECPAGDCVAYEPDPQDGDS
jgi:hypothetical protein